MDSLLLTCANPKCRKEFPASKNQKYTYNKAQAAGEPRRFYCSKQCTPKKEFQERIQWHCDNPACRKQFEMRCNQMRRLREAEANGTLADNLFFCSVYCKSTDPELNARRAERGLENIGRFTEANLEAYWQKVVDPFYYTTNRRYMDATALSDREQGRRIARSTRARKG